MKQTFFLPIDKLVYVTNTNNHTFAGFFQGFIDFAGMPSIYLTDNKSDGSIEETIIPITQVTSFKTTKAKTMIIE